MILINYRGEFVGTFKINGATDNLTEAGEPWKTVLFAGKVYRLKEETHGVYVEDSGPLVIPE